MTTRDPADGISITSNDRQTVHAISLMPPAHAHLCSCGSMWIHAAICAHEFDGWTCPPCVKIDEWAEHMKQTQENHHATK